jgi:NADPH:quinone reductase-like Zn-dependent oxidoreductase
MKPVMAAENRADLEVLTKLVEEGKLRPVIDRTFALPAAADAVRYLEGGHAAGKIVVTV